MTLPFPLKLDFSTVQNVTTAANNVNAPKPMGLQTHAVVISATVSAWVNFVDPTSGGASIASASQTVANPGVFTTVTQAFTAGTPVTIVGTPPGGFVNNKVYYVIATGLTTTACELSATYGGTGIQVTASSACSIQPLTPASATNSVLVKGSDPPMQYGISPGQYIGTIYVASTGTVNIVELTH